MFLFMDALMSNEANDLQEAGVLAKLLDKALNKMKIRMESNIIRIIGSPNDILSHTRHPVSDKIFTLVTESGNKYYVGGDEIRRAVNALGLEIIKKADYESIV